MHMLVELAQAHLFLSGILATFATQAILPSVSNVGPRVRAFFVK